MAWSLAAKNGFLYSAKVPYLTRAWAGASFLAALRDWSRLKMFLQNCARAARMERAISSRRWRRRMIHPPTTNTTTIQNAARRKLKMFPACGLEAAEAGLGFVV